MKTPGYKPAGTWPHGKKLKAAFAKVLDDGWYINRTVEWYGLDAKSFARHLKTERLRRGLPGTKKEETALAREKANRTANKMATEEVGTRGDTNGVLRKSLNPDFVLRPDFVSERRIPPPDDFDRMYFSHFPCPDCDEIHPSKPFHSEIRSMCQDEGIMRGLCLTPPYHAKTTVGSVRDTVYDIAKNPNSRTLIISETKPFAQNILGGIKALLSDPAMYVGAERNLIEDWGPFFEQGQTWNKEAIIVTGRQTAEIDPTVQCIGYRGQVYGRRAEKIKSDDIASYHNMANPEQVISMLEWFDGQVLSRIGKRARMLWFGTRVRPGDIYESLLKREGYHIIRYAAITDEATQETLWPEHFPYDFACLRRGEMDPAMWQLVYQNVQILTEGTSFPHDAIEAAKDTDHRVGQHDSGHFLIAGLDPAGAGKDSGYTAFVLLAVDPHSNHVTVVDVYREKAMKAPDMKKKMLEWSDHYPLYAWVCEVNGVQRQLTQYNEDIVIPLAARGIPIIPHVTNQNKWDDQFGIESMIPLFVNNMVTIPWQGANQHMRDFVDELRHWPLAPVTDMVMAFWFAMIGCRDISNRATMPLFDSRTKRWPKRIRERRHLVNFNNNTAEQIPLHAQDSRLWQDQQRHTAGTPTMYPEVLAEAERARHPDQVRYMNREGFVNVPDSD